MKFVTIRFAFRALVSLLTTIGFSYQIYRICNEYFTYPTTTLVTHIDIPEITILPMIGFKSDFNIDIADRFSIRQLFDKINDTTTLSKYWYWYQDDFLLGKMTTTRFFKPPHYYISLSSTEPLEVTAESLYTFNLPVIVAFVNTSII